MLTVNDAMIQLRVLSILTRSEERMLYGVVADCAGEALLSILTRSEERML